MWTPTPSSDELYHHGILGQKWGKRNGPPYPLNSSAKSAREKEYARQNMKTATVKNISNWGKSRDNNVLYIRGVSGSGKSTVANSYKDKNTNVIHLDCYTELQNLKSKDRNKAFDDYLKGEKFNVRGITKAEPDIKKRFKNMDVFAEHLQNFSKEQFDKGKKVIAEGVQLNDETIFADKKFFDDKPTITLNTNKDLARRRAVERDTDSKTYKKVANKVFNEAKANEPQITNDFTQALLPTTANPFGLEHKLKTQDSIARKIEKKSKEDGVLANDAARDIKDAVRYTAMSNDNSFVKNYNTIKKSLESKGYTETRCKNYWDEYRQGKVKHKSVQCNYKSPNGYEFEIQFHTPSSQDAKTKKIPIYEEARKVGVNPKRKAELEEQMVTLAENVTEPKDIYKIRSH